MVSNPTPAATVSGYANNPLCLDDTEFSVFNTLPKHEALWIPLLHQAWHPAQVSQPAWGCVIRHQAAFPRLSRVIKALSVTAPCLAVPQPRGAPAPCGSRSQSCPDGWTRVNELRREPHGALLAGGTSL